MSGWFAEKLDSHSPSRVFISHGANITEGAALGITSQVAQVRKAVLGLAAATAVALPEPAMAVGVPDNSAAVASHPAARPSPASLPALSAPDLGGRRGVGEQYLVTVHLTQNFTINGSEGPGVVDQVRKAGQLSLDELERMMDRVMYNKRRRDYAEIT
ncbi:hypothetical protein D3C78_1530620 [compost metagenome]